MDTQWARKMTAQWRFPQRCLSIRLHSASQSSYTSVLKVHPRVQCEEKCQISAQIKAPDIKTRRTRRWGWKWRQKAWKVICEVSQSQSALRERDGDREINVWEKEQELRGRSDTVGTLALQSHCSENRFWGGRRGHTPTPTSLPPSPGPWESAPSAEGNWPKDWGLALPHNRAIQPGGCQPCSACCPQDSLVCGSSAPGQWRGQIRNAGSDSLGHAPPLPTTQPHFSLCPSLGGWGPQTFCSSQLSEMGQLSLLFPPHPQWKPDYDFLFLFPPHCGCLTSSTGPRA